MRKEEFDDIAPYDDSNFQEKMSRLVEEPGFEHAVRYVMPDVYYPEFVKGLLAIKTMNSFQLDVMAPFLEMLARKTTSGISISGLENREAGRNYTYITNHRDIVLDASFLNLCLIRNKVETTEVAIGSNLLIYDWIRDLVKLNGSFIVKRNLPTKQALCAAKQLSGYIHYAVNEKHKSVWIAQREGRAKDSSDWTQESLVKMMGLSGGGTLQENLKAINLLPVSISYEYDPNDYLKAREFLLKRNNPEFKKSQRDDLFSMETGLLQYKGRVHFSIGKCINAGLEEVGECEDKNEVLNRVCNLIDHSIHSGYRIYPINYIAYDELNGTNEYAGNYTPQEAADFNVYMDGQLSKVDLPDLTDDDTAYMRRMMLTMYANPLHNKLNAQK